MKSTAALLLLAVTSLVFTGSPMIQANDATKAHDVELLMPNVHPRQADTYLCRSMKMSKDPQYIVGFKPQASMKQAHHILVYGCTEPGDSTTVWECGEMDIKSKSANADVAPVCKSDFQHILYAWAMDAPDLHLPDGVGFKVGGGTSIKWLVLQVHYKDVSHFTTSNNTDKSGVSLVTTIEKQDKTAGVYLLATGGEIPAYSTTYMETACLYTQPIILHPFAFRTHAHSHGRVNSGYIVRDGKWIEIGRMSPQQPQMFYNVTHADLIVRSGDILAARCTMVNNEDRNIQVGPTSTDEMCNFYVMYYVNGDELPRDQFCVTPGPPLWSWDMLKNVESPPISASIVPGTDELLTQTTINVDDKLLQLLQDIDYDAYYKQ